MSVKITDLVDQDTIDKIAELNGEMQKALTTYQTAARDMAKGLQIEVKVAGDLDRLEQLLVSKTKEAVEAQNRLNAAVAEQNRVLGDTSNTIARALMEKERVNKLTREEYTEGAKVSAMLAGMSERYSENARALARLELEIKSNKEEQRNLEAQYRNNLLTEEAYIDRQSKLLAVGRDLAVQKSKLQQVMKVEEKMNNEAEGSYNRLSQQLELLKKAYKDMNDEQKASEEGMELERQIQELDAHLKDLAADMGEHQRNVGNYAIAMGGASKSIKSDLKDLVLEIANLTIAYERLSEEEKNSAQGKELSAKIMSLTEDAAVLRDVIGDTNAAISNAASDTRALDQFAGAAQLAIDGFGLATGAAEMLGISTGELAEIQTKLQAAIAASNAMQSIQNTLQAQSSVMQGVALVQTRLRTTAENLHTMAKGKGTVATAALTAAQWAFNAAANANPIGLLVVGLTAAIAAVWGLVKAFGAIFGPSKDAVKAYEDQKEILGQLCDVNDRLIARMKARGATETELLTQSLKNKQMEKEAADLLFESAEKLYKKDSDEYREALDAKKKAEEEYQASVEDSVNYLMKIKLQVDAKERENAIGTLAYKIEIIEEEKKKQLELAELLYKNGELTRQVYEEIVASVNKAAEMKVNDLNEAEQKKTGKKTSGGSDAVNEAQRKAEELKKAVQAGEDALLCVISDSLERQREAEMLSYARRLKDLQEQLAKTKDSQMLLRTSIHRQLEGLESEHQRKMVEIQYSERERYIRTEADFISSHLSIVKEGSAEELEWKLKSLDNQMQSELLAIAKAEEEKTLAVEMAEEMRANIVQKYAELQKKAIEDNAGAQAQKIMDVYAGEEVKRNEEYSNAVNALKQRYAEELKAANGNAAEQERMRKQLDDDLYKLDEEYTRKSAEAAVDMIEEILNLSEMSAEDRLMWERKLTEAKIDLYNQDADAAIGAAERKKRDQDAKDEERMRKLNEWANFAKERISDVGGLVDALFDRRTQRLEEEIEANTDAGDKEQERIAELVNKKVITEEEGEARKRAAAAQTAKKNEELEKKKAELQHKQAVFQKATDLAQAGISTALAITNALTTSPFPLALAMAAVAGAIGAVQIATILATPIPKYAKGTERHKGGPAIVGDGGRSEVVVFRGEAWLTPDRPTLVDIPEGAKVIPDIKAYDVNGLSLMNVEAPVSAPKVIVNNDYSELRHEMREVAMLIRRQTLEQRRIAYSQQYEIFKKTRI